MNGIKWEEKLKKFLINFEYKSDVIGVLVCGSFITGNPTSHSDLDVHLILNNNVNYRERGNKIIDGLLIEYFANPSKQIRQYFKEDYEQFSLMSQTQFATGIIIEDKLGEVLKLKDEAINFINLNFQDLEEVKMTALDKYSLWDMLDDLEDALKENRLDFDFLYFNNLNKLIEKHLRLIKHPYSKKSIFGNIASEIVRKKYLLRQIDDPDLAKTIVAAITETKKEVRLSHYKELTYMFFRKTGGFNIDGFSFKSDINIPEK